ncbi:TetR/AcrR family transcriptional regulator [Amycolatopsis sp., V23-08]|uniref:TetR/AcrR family transcriptional regulator n=1 Tax=Amycolatopsis heterodermiae TaxID=3110235 RepID=A0ABU5R3Q4_9PSEU|nr:TetR/AcrR family transcriptional regulator [Amycolatopsis sp., V23-08]MEA5360838.1 TetR/AcrR family transcriptional regulator [Amycolatopsis sp., V23-08]
MPSEQPPAAGEPSPRRGKAREDAILAAAVELIGEVGYDRISMDAIAARAKASKMTIYRKWPGKAELVAEALRRRAEGETLHIADTGTLRGDLIAAVEGIARALTGERGPSLLGLLGAVREDPALRDLVRTQIDGTSNAVATAIAHRATTRGEPLTAANPSMVLGLAVAQLVLSTLLNGTPPDTEARHRLVDEVVLPLLTFAAP